MKGFGYSDTVRELITAGCGRSRVAITRKLSKMLGSELGGIFLKD